MNWKEAEKLMFDRGYSLMSQVTHPRVYVSVSNIVKQTYISELHGIRIIAEVTTEMEECHNCWSVRLTYTLLPLFMLIDTQKFNLQRGDFAIVEKALVAYAEHNKGFAPLGTGLSSAGDGA